MEYRVENFINNKDVITGKYTAVNDPGKKDVIIGYIGDGTSEIVDQACKAAETAYKKWKNYTLDERCDIMISAAKSINLDTEKLGLLHARESGQFLESGIRIISSFGQSIIMQTNKARNIFKPVIEEDDKCWVSVDKIPLGVVAAITTWNVPFMITLEKVVPAIAAGNSVVVKTSPHYTLALTIALKEWAMNLPEGLLNIVHGDIEVGSALSSHPFIKKISMTGGINAARSIMKNAADTLKKLHFELGGNAPAIVTDDVDIEEIVESLVKGAFLNCGQICVATKRIYVHTSIYKEFVDKYLEITDKYNIGYQLNSNADFGPVNNEMQYNFVKGLIKRTKEEGAKVHEMGTKLEPENWDKGYYIQPTVVTDVDPLSEVVVVEQFGPVIPIVEYHDENQMLEWVNGTDYGLASSLFCRNMERAIKIVKKIEDARTNVNGKTVSQLPMKLVPFGGIKNSGMGWAGMLEYIDYHSIIVKKN